jgi:hypothetical protein
MAGAQTSEMRATFTLGRKILSGNRSVKNMQFC